MLFAARKLGFQAVPLEGAYEDLPDVTCPSIVLFRKPDQEQMEFRILFDINPESALVATSRPATSKA